MRGGVRNAKSDAQLSEFGRSRVVIKQLGNSVWICSMRYKCTGERLGGHSSGGGIEGLEKLRTYEMATERCTSTGSDLLQEVKRKYCV